jgi:hypothetical protein
MLCNIQTQSEHQTQNKQMEILFFFCWARETKGSETSLRGSPKLENTLGSEVRQLGDFN